MLLDYWDFTMGSAFSATGQLPKRGALPTANWRGCDDVIPAVKWAHEELVKIYS
jgi:hypothetical protein